MPSDRETRLGTACAREFADMVDCVGVKKFAQSMGVSPRQVNRMLSGAQPNPIDRIIRSLQSCPVEQRRRVADFICSELGGHFVRQDGIDDASVNAVRECAQAIAAISDGKVSDVDVREVREAISALSSLILALRAARMREHEAAHSDRSVPDRGTRARST